MISSSKPTLSQRVYILNWQATGIFFTHPESLHLNEMEYVSGVANGKLPCDARLPPSGCWALAEGNTPWWNALQNMSGLERSGLGKIEFFYSSETWFKYQLVSDLKWRGSLSLKKRLGHRRPQQKCAIILPLIFNYFILHKKKIFLEIHISNYLIKMTNKSYWVIRYKDIIL